MKVLVTGAFGLLGRSTIEALLARGHEVRAFDIEKPAAVRAARPFRGKVETVWGDIRSESQVAAAAEDVEAAVHLAFILPPLSEKDPDSARRVNVDGTAGLIEALKARGGPQKSSSPPPSASTASLRTASLPSGPTMARPQTTTTRATSSKPRT